MSAVSYQQQTNPTTSTTAVLNNTDRAIHFINRGDEIIKRVSEWKLFALIIGLPMRILWILPALGVQLMQWANPHTIEIGDTPYSFRVDTWGGWGPTVQYKSNYQFFTKENKPVYSDDEEPYKVTRTDRVTLIWTARELGEEVRSESDYW